MDIKSNLQLLSEAAALDMKINTSNDANLDTVREAYNAIPTIKEPAVTEATDVIVNDTASGYYVEMVNLAPFMMDSGIKSVSRALDMVAEANNLPAKSVGLVVESQTSVDTTLRAAKSRSDRTGNNKFVENAISKVNKNNVLIHKLLSEGYKVAKKSDDSKVCPKCGKVLSKCTCKEGCAKEGCTKKECGDGSTSGSSDQGTSVIAEGKKKACSEAAKIVAELLSEGYDLTQEQILSIQESAEDVEKEVDRIAVSKTEKDADKALLAYYKKASSKYQLGLVGKGAGIGAGVGGVAGGVAGSVGGPAGAVSGAATGAYVGSMIGISVTCIYLITVVGKITDKMLKINGDILKKHRSLEKLLDMVDDDIAAAKKAGKKKDVAKLTAARAKVTKAMDKLDRLQADKVQKVKGAQG